MTFDVVLESLVGIVSIALAYQIYKNKERISAFSWGFIFIAFSAVLDVVDEFMDHVLLDVGGKGLFIFGLMFIMTVFHKELKV
jgi:hypothetical protein